MIDREEMTELGTVLKNNKSIRCFVLSNCSMDADLIKILIDNGLCYNRTITNLHIVEDIIDLDGIKQLTEFLGTENAINIFKLHVGHICFNMALEFARVLKSNTILTELLFSYTKIEPDSVILIARALRYNKTLSFVDLGELYNHGRRRNDVKEVLEELMTTGNSDRVISLCMGSNEPKSFFRKIEGNTDVSLVNSRWYYALIESDLKKIVAAFEIDPPPSVLELSKKKISDDGIIRLSQFLQRNTTVITLYLAENGFGTKGIIALADMLACNNTLRNLFLDWNYFGDNMHLLNREWVSKNTSLELLSLCWNDIGDMDMEHVAKILRASNSLNAIILDHNKIGDTGIQILYAFLKLSPSRMIEKLSLRYNKITDDSFNNLGMIAMHQNFKSILLDNNKFTEDFARELTFIFIKYSMSIS